MMPSLILFFFFAVGVSQKISNLCCLHSPPSSHAFPPPRRAARIIDAPQKDAKKVKKLEAQIPYYGEFYARHIIFSLRRRHHS